MPVNKQSVRHPRSQRIRRHLPVSKPHDQHGFFSFRISNQFLQLHRKFLRHLLLILLLVVSKLSGFQCNVCSDRFPHNFCAVFRLYFYPRHQNSRFRSGFFFQNYPVNLNAGLPNPFPLFQCKICPNGKSAHSHSLLLRLCFLQFTRAIRNTIECTLREHSIVMNRASTLSAASQLIFAHKVAFPSYLFVSRFSCEHEICLQTVRVNCKNYIPIFSKNPENIY